MNFRIFISIIFAVWCTQQIGCLPCSKVQEAPAQSMAELMEMTSNLENNDGAYIAIAETYVYQSPSHSHKRCGGQKWENSSFKHSTIVLCKVTSSKMSQQMYLT